MKYIIEIIPLKEKNNEKYTKSILTLGYKSVKEVLTRKIYLFKGEIKKHILHVIASHLLIDPVVEHYNIVKKISKSKNETVVNIWYKPQVLDVEAMYVKKAIQYMNIKDKFVVSSGFQLRFRPKITHKVVSNIVEKLFMNPLIQYYEII